MDVYGHFGIQRTADEFRSEIAEFNGQISAEVFYNGTKLANPNRPISQDTVLDLGGCEAQRPNFMRSRRPREGTRGRTLSRLLGLSISSSMVGGYR
jgi:hypothetical protein